MHFKLSSNLVIYDLMFTACPGNFLQCLFITILLFRKPECYFSIIKMFISQFKKVHCI